MSLVADSCILEGMKIENEEEVDQLSTNGLVLFLTMVAGAAYVIGRSLG